MAGGHENLIPANKRTEAELREMTRNGGIKSGEARRKKRSLKEKYKLLDEFYTEKQLKTQVDEEIRKMLGEVGYRAFKRYQMLNDPKVADNLKEKIISEIDEREEGKTVEHAKIEGKVNIDKVLVEIVNGTTNKGDKSIKENS
jgi:hypothetical protein